MLRITVRIETEPKEETGRSYPSRQTLAEFTFDTAPHLAWKVYRDNVGFLTEPMKEVSDA